MVRSVARILQGVLTERMTGNTECSGSVPFLPPGFVQLALEAAVSVRVR